MRYSGPKVKRSRSLGIPLTPKAAKVMERRPNPPGQHGPTVRRTKMSDYKRQLLEKQRLRFQYNISERQMVNYYLKASRLQGATGDNLIRLLETRLDALVYRAGLARTIYAARQYVNHGHIQVNGQKVDIPSFQLKVGDVLSVKPSSQNLVCFEEALQEANPPIYLNLTANQKSARLVNIPLRDDVGVICEVPLVVEYYSR